MSTDRETTRIVRSWLEDGATALPDRVLDAVLDELPMTPQRRSWWPARRLSTVNTIIKFGLAAAVVAVVVLIGINSLGGTSSVGGPGVEPTPTPQPSIAEPTPEPSAAGPIDFATIPLEGDQRLEEGDYVFTHLPGVRVVFAASSNWERNLPNWIVWTIDDNKATMGAATVDNVVIDPCQPDLGFQDPPVGPTVDDLVTALGAVPGLTFSAPADVTQDGYSGVRLDYVSPDEFDNCLDDMGEAILMSVDGAVPADHGSIHAPNGADAFSLYIYDVDGTRVVITAAYTESRTDELDEMLASIRFEQP